MLEIRPVNKTFDSGIPTHEIKGKKVMALNGKEIGRVTEVRLDPKTLSLDGIEIDRGFFGKDTFIGKMYITSLSKDGAVLNMSPVSDYKGLKVFDSTGKEIGTIKNVQTKGHSNTVTGIIVATGLLKSDLVFNKSDVKSVGDSILLNIPVDVDAVQVAAPENKKQDTPSITV